MQEIHMAPGTHAQQPIPSRLACSYERPDLGWDQPLKIYVATDRDMVTLVLPWSKTLRKGGGSAHYSGTDALLNAKKHMEQFTLECQPKPEWAREIPTMDGFPARVKGFDWTALPMTAPPVEATHVGYFCWCNNEFDGEEEYIVDCRNDYYVLPDGGAKIVRKRDDEVEEEIFAPGTWEPEYPSTNFGSRGGIWVQANSRQLETVAEQTIS